MNEGRLKMSEEPLTLREARAYYAGILDSLSIVTCCRTILEAENRLVNSLKVVKEIADNLKEKK
jgi:hypothetical protein